MSKSLSVLIKRNLPTGQRPGGAAALAQLRAAKIPSELYPDASKLQKQFKYADAKGIPLVLLLGPEELAAGVVKK